VPQQHPERRQVFISYTRVDREWVDRLQRMMKPLLRDRGQQIELWDDSLIEPGAKWRAAIEMALAQAKVAVLLVSDDFLASEFVMNEEVPKLLAAAEAEGVRVLWVSLSPCMVEHTAIGAYQAVLPLDQYLLEMDKPRQQRALKAIAECIRETLAAQAPKPPETTKAGARHGTRTGSDVDLSSTSVDAKEGSTSVPVPSQPGPSAPEGHRVSVSTGYSRSIGHGFSTSSGSYTTGWSTSSHVAQDYLLPQEFELESALIMRAGNGWEVQRQPLLVQGALIELGGGVSLPLVRIPAGEFVMGSPADEPLRSVDEGPQHQVQLGEFWMGQSPITQAQWRAVMARNPSRFQDQPDSDQRPVEMVIWYHAMEFCRRLSERSGRRFTLPSEAQWEYACRAGNTTPFSFGETITTKLGNYYGTYTYANGPKGEYRMQTTPVGIFPSNAWGLQDMHGNVREWCLDQWRDSYAGAPADGSAWIVSEDETSGASRLLRGGSWSTYPWYCRSAFRGHFQPDDASNDVGFRVACIPQDPSINS
jgi:formylglycine-generating enzyme required for sulfatase activity